VHQNPYTEILATLAAKQVAFVVCGGVACVLRGVERVTVDVDISLQLTGPNLERFLQAARALELTPRVPVDPEALLDQKFRNEVVREKNALVFTFVDTDRPIRQIDIFLIPELSYENLVAHSTWVECGQFRVRCLSATKLIELKRAITPPRTKDLLDIEELEKQLGS